MNDLNLNRRISVDEYHEMARTGVLLDGDPIELLEGRLVAKMTKNRAHSFSTRTTRIALERVLPAGWFVDSQEPITLEDSEPEPDGSVVEGEPDRYRTRHPGPTEVALVVEVAEASLRQDQGQKKAIYARAGIPVYWIVNLVDGQLEVYTDPSGSDYGRTDVFRPGEQAPVVLRGQTVGHVAVRDLLP